MVSLTIGRPSSRSAPRWTGLTAICRLGSQMAERLGNRAIIQKVAGLIPGRAKMMLCPWARHFTLLASGGNVPVLTVSPSG